MIDEKTALGNANRIIFKGVHYMYNQQYHQNNNSYQSPNQQYNQQYNQGMNYSGNMNQPQQYGNMRDMISFERTNGELKLQFNELANYVEKVSKQFALEMKLAIDSEYNMLYVEVDGVKEDFLLNSGMANMNSNDEIYEYARIYIISPEHFATEIQAGANTRSIFQRLKAKAQGRDQYITPRMMAGPNMGVNFSISLTRALKVLFPDLNDYVSFKDLPLYPVSFDVDGSDVDPATKEMYENFMAFNYTSVDIVPTADKVYMMVIDQSRYNNVQPTTYMGQQAPPQPHIKNEVAALMTVSYKSTELENNGGTKYDLVITSYVESLTANVPDLFELLIQIVAADTMKDGFINSFKCIVNPCVPAEARYIHEVSEISGVRPLIMHNVAYAPTYYYHFGDTNSCYNVDSLNDPEVLAKLFPGKADKAIIDKLNSMAELDQFVISKKGKKFAGPISPIADVDPRVIRHPMVGGNAGGMNYAPQYQQQPHGLQYQQPQQQPQYCAQPSYQPQPQYQQQQPVYQQQPQQGYQQQQPNYAQPQNPQYQQQQPGYDTYGQPIQPWNR